MKNVIDFYEKNSIEILFANSEHNFPLHSHECFCFGIVEEGEVTFTIDGKQTVLSTGISCSPDNWNSRTSEVKDERSNNQLKAFRDRIEENQGKLIKYLNDN